MLRVYLEPSVLRMLLLGFSAGLPLLLVLGTLSFRLREAGIGRATIGYLSWVGLAYTVKSGDTLSKIAKRFYGDANHYHQIAAANDIANPDRIDVGQELKLP